MKSLKDIYKEVLGELNVNSFQVKYILSAAHKGMQDRISFYLFNRPNAPLQMIEKELGDMSYEEIKDLLTTLNLDPHEGDMLREEEEFNPAEEYESFLPRNSVLKVRFSDSRHHSETDCYILDDGRDIKEIAYNSYKNQIRREVNDYTQIDGYLDELKAALTELIKQDPKTFTAKGKQISVNTFIKLYKKDAYVRKSILNITDPLLKEFAKGFDEFRHISNPEEGLWEIGTGEESLTFFIDANSSAAARLTKAGATLDNVNTPDFTAIFVEDEGILWQGILWQGAGFHAGASEALKASEVLKEMFEHYIMNDIENIWEHSELIPYKKPGIDTDPFKKPDLSKVDPETLNAPMASLYSKINKEGIDDPVKPGILKKRLGTLSCTRVRAAKAGLKDKGTHYAKALQRYLNYHCK